ncbi:MAG: rhamnulokinase [Ruminococcaceae bacterium]|nr:rhamnulokinase [Oscillospiraceae bacterium]
MAKRILAFDFGASSGRAMIATFDGTKIDLKEIHRFSNDPVLVNGTLYWDTLRLFHEIKQGITKAWHDGGFDSIGIDTWGVDFGLFDKDGRMLENPIHYRDTRTDGIMDKAFAIVPREDIYNSTGIQIMKINTLFQLVSIAQNRPELLERADKLLFTPDLFNYLLTGNMTTEYTIASTSQMLDVFSRDWDKEMLRKLGIPSHILTDIVQPGTVVGKLSDAICEELGVPAVDVIAIASHDTASAVISVPAIPPQDKDFIYISCGTWSLFGTELDQPIVNEDSIRYNFTNEGGYNGTIRYLKNIMGLWLIQESRRQWIREGQNVSYADLEREALAVAPFRCFIDPDEDIFSGPGNMPKRVREFCEKTGQYVPQTTGEVMRCIYESLAMKYRYTLNALEDITGKKYNSMHVVGGGTKDNFLCQLAANACKIPVIAGPIEATVLGNAVNQLMASGDVADLAEARKVISNSFDTIRYEPKDTADWDSAYENFVKIINR